MCPRSFFHNIYIDIYLYIDRYIYVLIFSQMIGLVRLVCVYILGHNRERKSKGF